MIEMFPLTQLCVFFLGRKMSKKRQSSGDNILPHISVHVKWVKSIIVQSSGVWLVFRLPIWHLPLTNANIFRWIYCRSHFSECHAIQLKTEQFVFYLKRAWRARQFLTRTKKKKKEYSIVSVSYFISGHFVICPKLVAQHERKRKTLSFFSPTTTRVVREMRCTF